MLFASRELAARIEAAECRLLKDGAASIAARHPDAEVSVLPLCGGVAVYTVEYSPLNKAAGLGFEGAVNDAELAEVEREFATRGAAVRVELSNLADPAVGATLTQRGYVLHGFENVLGRSLADVRPVVAEEIEIHQSGEDEIARWIDVIVTGFMNPDTQGIESSEAFPRETLESILDDLMRAEGYQRYLAYIEGAPAGGASMRSFEGIAQLTGAATLPEFRRRGVQTALLRARLAHAKSAGCDVAVVTTLPGSKSHENVQKQGFELLYTRAILVKDPPG